MNSCECCRTKYRTEKTIVTTLSHESLGTTSKRVFFLRCIAHKLDEKHNSTVVGAVQRGMKRAVRETVNKQTH